MKSCLYSFILCYFGLVSLNLAGTADSTIRGKTQSGRTELELSVGDIQGLIRSAKLSIDGESYTIREEEITHQTVIRDEKNGIYILSFVTKDKEFRLWMIPNTEKILEKSYGVYRSRFAGVLEATDPRREKLGLCPRITMACSLEWIL